MRRTRPSTYAVGLALTAILVVAGCTSNPTPTPGGSSTPPAASTTSASTTSSAAPTTPETSATTPTAIDPNIPPAAMAQTTDGAIAFMKYFYTQVNTAWTKPESGLISVLSTTACKTCKNFEANAVEYVAKNARYDKIPVEIQEVSSHGPAQPGTNQTLDVVYHQFAASVVDSAGKRLEDIQDVRGVSVVEVVWLGSNWKVDSIKVVR